MVDAFFYLGRVFGNKQAMTWKITDNLPQKVKIPNSTNFYIIDDTYHNDGFYFAKQREWCLLLCTSLKMVISYSLNLKSPSTYKK